MICLISTDIQKETETCLFWDVTPAVAFCGLISPVMSEQSRNQCTCRSQLCADQQKGYKPPQRRFLHPLHPSRAPPPSCSKALFYEPRTHDVPCIVRGSAAHLLSSPSFWKLIMKSGCCGNKTALCCFAVHELISIMNPKWQEFNISIHLSLSYGYAKWASQEAVENSHGDMHGIIVIKCVSIGHGARFFMSAMN